MCIYLPPLSSLSAAATQTVEEGTAGIHVATHREVQRVVDFLDSCSGNEASQDPQDDWQFGGFSSQDYTEGGGGGYGEWGGGEGRGNPSAVGGDGEREERQGHRGHSRSGSRSGSLLGFKDKPSSEGERGEPVDSDSPSEAKNLPFNFSNGFGPLISSKPAQHFNVDLYHSQHDYKLAGLDLYPDPDSDSELSG